MKIEDIDGTKAIILEENDTLILRTPNKPASVEVRYKDGSLDIEGPSSIIREIRGQGLLEKVHIPPVLPSEEILANCDEWFDLFSQCLNYFSILVVSDQYREQSMTMEVRFTKVFDSKTSSTLGTIKLLLSHLGTPIQEGPSIIVDEKNESVYKYLCGLVISKYIETNCNFEPINTGISWNKAIYSADYAHCKPVPKKMDLYNLIEEWGYQDFILSLLKCHNLNIEPDQVLNNLRCDIAPQAFESDFFDRSLARSRRQYSHIFPNSERAKKYKLDQKDDRK